MTAFVYIIERGAELDVYESLIDAEEASEILGGAEINEQVVFAESGADNGPGSTRAWLDNLRTERGLQ